MERVPEGVARFHPRPEHEDNFYRVTRFKDQRDSYSAESGGKALAVVQIGTNSGHGVRGSGGRRSLRHGLPRFAEIVAGVPPRCVCSNVDTPTGTRDLQFGRAGLQTSWRSGLYSSWRAVCSEGHRLGSFMAERSVKIPARVS